MNDHRSSDDESDYLSSADSLSGGSSGTDYGSGDEKLRIPGEGFDEEAPLLSFESGFTREIRQRFANLDKATPDEKLRILNQIDAFMVEKFPDDYISVKEKNWDALKALAEQPRFFKATPVRYGFSWLIGFMFTLGFNFAFGQIPGVTEFFSSGPGQRAFAEVMGCGGSIANFKTVQQTENTRLNKKTKIVAGLIACGITASTFWAANEFNDEAHNFDADGLLEQTAWQFITAVSLQQTLEYTWPWLMKGLKLCASGVSTAASYARDCCPGRSMS